MLLKGGCTTEDKREKIILEKYKVVSILHEGSGGIVYLAEHLIMHVIRVIKEVIKNSQYEECFYAEIKSLTSIHHKNIPIVYDVEEDESAFYIIEDYIEGITLHNLVKNSGVLTEERAVMYGRQLANLITFLHSIKPNPILFLDLQPKNIIVDGDNLYLIDFGNSLFFGDNSKEFVFGTPGFAAPEQYKGENIGFATDIYGIGALLFFMVTGKSLKSGYDLLDSKKDISQHYKQIVQRCIDNRCEYRYSDASKLEDNLNNIDRSIEISNCPLIISVVGIEHKVGTTFISLKISEELSKKGYDVVYIENNSSNHIRKFAKYHSDCIYSKGAFIYRGFRLVPKYSQNVTLEFDCDIVVRDEGVYDSNSVYEGYVLAVGNSSEWEIYTAKDFINTTDKYDVLVMNMFLPREQKDILSFLDSPKHVVFYEPCVNSEKGFDTTIFENLFKGVSKENVVKKKTKKKFSSFFRKV